MLPVPGRSGFLGAGNVVRPHQLETNMFEIQTGKMIWSTTSETLEPKFVDAATGSLAKAVIASLRENGLVK